MKETQPICELRRVTKRYSRTEALGGVDLQIWPGEFVALVGLSGAGKSTILNLLSGALFPSDGMVRVFGQDTACLSSRALRRLQRDIGMVHQQFHLVDNLRVIHNVNAGQLGRWSLLEACVSLIRPLQVEQAAAELSRVGIAGKLYERTDRLSGGEQQRVALARVLVQDPKLILADEPLSSLDPENSRAVMDLLRDLNREKEKTVILSLHDFHFALSHCPRLIGLRKGVVLFDAPAPTVSPEMVKELYELEWENQRGWEKV